ncbi:TonB-dependent receptor [Sphingomonas sp. 37zxx]|uniref:TonB-dependent receptor n=1 Tax=Sphingomonas sp. 37zxx TaxID=1550073 RepID=UPI00053C0210|nr:TonB-dependent receptor [Sphingomonas sp. 37zxx]
MVRSALFSSVAALGLLTQASGVHAQTATATPDAIAAPAAEQQDDPADEIVVTGYRESLRRALIEKRDGDRVQEVLSAQDIGKLPEASIAESLARLPGVTTNRDRGNGTAISIRGLGPNLVNTLLNGREIVSAEANRNIRYEQFPAELLNGAFVFKSPTAAQVEGAIAGQVDLRTVKPLEQNGSKLVVNIRGGLSTEADKVQDADPFGYIVSASYIGQLSDTLGFAIGYSGRRQAVATTRTNIFRYTNSFADLDGDGQGNDNIPFGFEALARGGDDIRHGALGAIQWQPSSNLEVNADFLYSHVAFDETQRGFRVEGLPFGNTLSGGVGQGGNITGITTTVFPGNESFGQVVRGVNELFFFEDDLYAGGLNARWSANGWTVRGDAAYSTTRRDQQFLTLRTEPVGFAPTTSFQSFRGRRPTMTINADLTDPNLFRIADFQIPENGGGAPIINDELKSGMLDIERELGGGLFRSIVVGGRFTDRSKDYTQRTQFGFIDPAARASTPDNLRNPNFYFGDQYAGLPGVQSIRILDAVEQLFGPINPTQSFFDQRSSWEVSEKTYAGYTQLNLAGNLFGLPVSGNAGVRMIRTETLSASTQINQTENPDGSVTNTAVPVATPNNFTDWLPNLNLNFKLTDKLQLRAGLSRAVSRAPLDDLNAGFGLFNFGAPEAVGGNPLLEPFRANQADLSLEWYFGRDSALTVAGFYKDLDTFIVPQVTTILAPNPAGGPDIEGTFRQPVNGNGGYIRGFEVLFQTAFSFLPAPLDGFGVYANYSFTDSNITVQEDDNAIGDIALPGLSKHVFNTVLYYSKAGLEARAGYRYRDSYATELGDTDRILFTAPEGVLDFQLSYEFPDTTPVGGLTLMFQANNLTNEPFETYYGDRALQGRFEQFGARYLFGFGFSL